MSPYLSRKRLLGSWEGWGGAFAGSVGGRLGTVAAAGHPAPPAIRGPGSVEERPGAVGALAPLEVAGVLGSERVYRRASNCSEAGREVALGRHPSVGVEGGDGDGRGGVPIEVRHGTLTERSVGVGREESPDRLSQLQRAVVSRAHPRREAHPRPPHRRTTGPERPRSAGAPQRSCDVRRPSRRNRGRGCPLRTRTSHHHLDR